MSRPTSRRDTRGKQVPAWLGVLIILVVVVMAYLAFSRIAKPRMGPEQTPEMKKIQGEIMETMRRTGGGPRMQQMRQGGQGGRAGARGGRGGRAGARGGGPPQGQPGQ